MGHLWSVKCPCCDPGEILKGMDSSTSKMQIHKNERKCRHWGCLGMLNVLSFVNVLAFAKQSTPNFHRRVAHRLLHFICIKTCRTPASTFPISQYLPRSHRQFYEVTSNTGCSTRSPTLRSILFLPVFLSVTASVMFHCGDK